MIRFVSRYTSLILCLAFLVLSVSCNRQAAIDAAKVDDASPEKRFERIMASFSRKIDGQPVGFVVTQGGSRSTMLGSNKVSSKLIKPATPSGHYKAIVTVTTESHYSLRRTKSAEEAEHEQHDKNQKNAADDPNDKKGIGILEPDLAGAPRTDAPQSPTSPAAPDEELVTRRPDEDIREYELVDDGQHWVLVTKLDHKTEQSIQFAFDEALRQQ